MYYDLIKTAIDVSSVRKNVISNNLANINTKDFKRSDVKFESILKSKVKPVVFKATNDKHIRIGNQYYRIVQDRNTSLRNDGNNVDIDIEKANQAANTLMYNALVTAMNNKINLHSMVINGSR